MNIFKIIREFFWPLLENGKPEKFEKLNKDCISGNTSHLSKLLEYTLSCYNGEEDRRKTIESKSSLFIGTISVITSVILGVTTVLVKENDFDITVLLLAFLLFTLTLYMSRTVWFSVKALERKNYQYLAVRDFILTSNEDEDLKDLIVKIDKMIGYNAKVINEKVDNMTMAQEYFKRAIVVVALYSFVILILFLSKSEIGWQTFAERVLYRMSKIDIYFYNTLVLYILSITSLVMSIIAVKKDRKRLKKSQQPVK